MRTAAISLALLFACLATRAGDSPPHRYFEFRDGSLLRLPLVDEDWRVKIIKPSGEVEETRIRSASLQSITLTSEPDFEKKRALLAMVQQLGSEFFRVREQAHAALVKQGPAIRGDLETCLQFTIDLETRARLRNILDGFKEAASPQRPGLMFDLLMTRESAWGHLGEKGIAVRIDGKEHRLDRKHLLAMTTSAPSTTPDVRRLGPGDFPSGCVEEGFESTPDGRALRIGENIEKLFIAKGFTLSTTLPPEMAPSWVSVNNFSVKGKSGGNSAATHNPLWQGEITIRFCEPGREKVPAGVTHFGCYIAAVTPQGTAMMGYDVEGRLLGTVYTKENGTDYLGIMSAVPMHRIRIVPNRQLDTDYTLDDFTFTPPVLCDAGHPEKFIVQLAGGDRIVCGDVSFRNGTMQVHGMPGGFPDRTVAVDELARVSFPEKIKGAASPTRDVPGLFAELHDGSVLFAKEAKGRPIFTRRPNLFQETNHLVGIWSTEYPRMLPSTKGNASRAWNSETKKWEDVSDVRFTENAVTWNRQGQSQTSPYSKLGPVWLAMPNEQPAAGWRVRTRQGEELVLTEPEKLDGRLSQQLKLTWQGRTIELSPGELATILKASQRP